VQKHEGEWQYSSHKLSTIVDQMSSHCHSMVSMLSFILKYTIRSTKPSAAASFPKRYESSCYARLVGSHFCDRMSTRAYSRGIYWRGIALARSVKRIGNGTFTGIDAEDSDIVRYRRVNSKLAIRRSNHPSVYTLCRIGINRRKIWRTF
jgi:hypothetical protein